MKALVFRYSLRRLAAARLLGAAHARGYFGPWSPLRIEDVPEPALHGDDWAVVRTSLAGICGSDAKQAFLRGDRDTPLTAVISFPHILGHEVTGTIERAGAAARLRKGQRVVLNPWLSCAPRGRSPLCANCANGAYQLCERFAEGALPPAIHLGNCASAGGAFAERLAAHASQLIPVPDGVADDQAVLADPFSVQLHAVLRHPPPAGGVALVYGCGTLGLMTVAMLRRLHPDVTVWAVARHPHQAALARALGAAEVFASHADALVERVGELTGIAPLRPWSGHPWLMRGPGVVYDTVGSAHTVETALRLVAPRGTLVISGVEAPRRFEWTPLYFKEVKVAGSNAFGVEEFEGRRLHAMEIYFELVRRGLDLSPLITHRFRLARYAGAFVAMRDHGKSRAVKCVFEFGR